MSAPSSPAAASFADSANAAGSADPNATSVGNVANTADEAQAVAEAHGASTTAADGTSGMPPERLTGELLERLLASSSIDTFLGEPDVGTRILTDYLRELLEARGMKRADVINRSGLNPTVVYDIFSGKSRPGRNNAIMIAIGLKCDLCETQRLLRLSGASELWCKQRRDAILIWCIEHGYTRAQTDDELYRLGEQTLLGTGRLSRTFRG